MLLLLSLGWGITWPAMRVALQEIPPFSMRMVRLALGATALMLTSLQGRRFGFARRKDWVARAWRRSSTSSAFTC